jgi:hypothetical protein
MTSDSSELPVEATAAGGTLDVLAAPYAPTGDLEMISKCSPVEAAATDMENRCSSDSGSVLGDPIAAKPSESSSLESSSSYGSHASAAEAAEAADPAPAAAAEHASSSAMQAQALKLSAVELLTADRASEVQLMAARVLQRKQHQSTAAARVNPQDPLHLLNNPDKGLRARKELLMSALSSSSADGGSSRVAAVKEELAGVQARLRDALGLRASSASGTSVNEEVGRDLVNTRVISVCHAVRCLSYSYIQHTEITALVDMQL